MPGGSKACKRRESTLASILTTLTALHSCLLYSVLVSMGTGAQPVLFSAESLVPRMGSGL